MGQLPLEQHADAAALSLAQRQHKHRRGGGTALHRVVVLPWYNDPRSAFEVGAVELHAQGKHTQISILLLMLNLLLRQKNLDVLT